jgi:glycosyltransferase involved in cell wall biosynthesis
MTADAPRIAVVVPCFRVRRQVLQVIGRIGIDVERIYAVDDFCPEQSGTLIEQQCSDPRVRVLRHAENQGVGGATVTGYREALADGADIVVKVDGDGQMDPAMISRLTQPLVSGVADYAKGNRFYDLEHVRTMPPLRLFGNAVLSLINKMVSGYWNVMDPTNGFTAIHRNALAAIPLAKLDRGYFFESDMLFRLYTIRAVVRDVPLPSRYGDEASSLRVGRVAAVFPFKYLRAMVKRLFYAYFLRDFNAGTLQLSLGLLIGGAGAVFGIATWMHSAITGIPATAGTVMLAGLPVLAGLQFLIGALHYDIESVPREPLQGRAGHLATSADL